MNALCIPEIFSHFRCPHQARKMKSVCCLGHVYTYDISRTRTTHTYILSFHHLNPPQWRRLFSSLFKFKRRCFMPICRTHTYVLIATDGVHEGRGLDVTHPGDPAAGNHTMYSFIHLYLGLHRGNHSAAAGAGAGCCLHRSGSACLLIYVSTATITLRQLALVQGEAWVWPSQ